jgi:hypothetical protein
MFTLVRLKRALFVAQEIFASADSTELAEIVLLCLLGMIASLLIITPGDRTVAAIDTLCSWIAACA